MTKTGDLTIPPRVRRGFKARIEGGLIHWDDPYPGDQMRRMVSIGDRQIPMESGCGPDVFTFVGVLDVPFRVEETCPATGTPIRVHFVPDGYERVDPPEAVTVLLHPEDLRESIGRGFEELFERPWFIYYRDNLRPLIHASNRV